MHYSLDKMRRQKNLQENLLQCFKKIIRGYVCPKSYGLFYYVSFSLYSPVPDIINDL